jgi:hypothetical protein
MSRKRNGLEVLVMNKEQIIELLPEYVNGSLEKDIRGIIEDAAKTDEVIRLEIEFLDSVRDSIKEEKVISPTEWGLARLKQSLVHQDTEQEELPVQLNSPVSPKQYNPLWKKFALAASVAFVLQSGYLVQSQFVTDEGYRTLSTAELKDSIQVQFKDNAREHQIRRLLIDLGGNIVKGPSAIGIYNIQFLSTSTALKTLEKIDFIEYLEQE